MQVPGGVAEAPRAARASLDYLIPAPAELATSSPAHKASAPGCSLMTTLPR